MDQSSVRIGEFLWGLLPTLIGGKEPPPPPQSEPTKETVLSVIDSGSEAMTLADFYEQDKLKGKKNCKPDQ